MSFFSRASPPSIFPTYLFPPLPFRRRNASAGSSEAFTTPGFLPKTKDVGISTLSKYLNGQSAYIRCARCAADLCPTSQIISKGFTGRHGRAYLVSASSSAHGHSTMPPFTETPSLPNTHTHKAVPRQLVTGAHTVSDVSCAFCGNVLGWKYVAAEEESQGYKVGKFILETKKVCAATCWEDEHGKDLPSLDFSEMETDGGIVDFDSQDEDECEELFAGVWSPVHALKKRQAKTFGRDRVS